ncbi:MAG: sigma-70 family RNA polymerase sigma factor [Victivallales bacterium]|nr:sigma-70 family RNA polymerase sigma factor [Victivallales bacterium]
MQTTQCDWAPAGFDLGRPDFSQINISQFLELYGRLITAYCHQFGVYDEEMDIADRIALKIFGGTGISYNPAVAPFPAYLARMVKNYCLARFRKKHPIPVEDCILEAYAADAPDIAARIGAEDADRLLAAARKAVDARRGELARRVFALRWEQGLSAAETAKRAGIAPTTANTAYCRYLADLRATIREIYRADGIRA